MKICVGREDAENDTTRPIYVETFRIMGVEVLNLTPHDINLFYFDEFIEKERFITIPPCGFVARIGSNDIDVFPKIGDDFPIVKTIFGRPEGLPESVDGVFFITSSIVAQSVKRGDVISPNTGKSAIRENGNIVGVTSFQRW